ncbi:MAG: transcriptional regulator GcvA [Arenicellales bacterium]
MNPLPPLNALRAFEAAARHLSFTKAAEELNVTPGAISQQIKVLESYLGLALFKRKNRMILLTEQAQVCLPYLSQGLNNFSEGMRAIEQFNQTKPLTITVAEAFASRWLMPRLRNFQALHPDIDVRIDASKKLIDLNNSDVDAGIRFGSGNYTGLVTDFLLPLEVYPVCSPSLLNNKPPIKTAADLQHFTLIHGDYYYFGASQPDWAMWFKTLGINDIDSNRGLRYESAELVVKAAVEGQGIALTGSVIVENDLKAGRLIRPLDHTIPLDFAFYFVCTEAKAQQKNVAAFRQWLLEEVKTELNALS